MESAPLDEWFCNRCSQEDTDNDAESAAVEGTEEEDDIMCERCHKTDGECTMLLCDGSGCGERWHMACLPTPLFSLPEGD